jgi:hypothetical protein
MECLVSASTQSGTYQYTNRGVQSKPLYRYRTATGDYKHVNRATQAEVNGRPKGQGNALMM